MPFEKGNQLGVRRKKFLNAIEQEIKDALSRPSDQRRDYLREIAQQMLSQAADGSLFAMGMVRDTLDGKPKQDIDIKQEHTFITTLSAADQLKQKIRGVIEDVGYTEQLSISNNSEYESVEGNEPDY